MGINSKGPFIIVGVNVVVPEELIGLFPIFDFNGDDARSVSCLYGSEYQ